MGAQEPPVHGIHSTKVICGGVTELTECITVLRPGFLSGSHPSKTFSKENERGDAPNLGNTHSIFNWRYLLQ
jgi:hypothetical protein